MVEDEMVMGFSPFGRYRNCLSINIKMSNELKLQLYYMMYVFDSTTREGLGHGKTGKVLNDVAHWTS
jgi:hypothetical protein